MMKQLIKRLKDWALPTVKKMKPLALFKSYAPKVEPPGNRSWRYVCEMTEFEVFEAVEHLTGDEWNWHAVQVRGMERPGQGYKNVFLHRVPGHQHHQIKQGEHFAQLHLRDDGAVMLWMQREGNWTLHFHFPEYLEYLRSINVKTPNQKERYHASGES